MTKDLKHIHILLKAEVAYPEILNIEQLKGWAERIVRSQGLEPVAGPFVSMVEDEGNRGPTGGVHIKTSHFAFHIWDELGVIQADLYTCGDLNIDLFIDQFAVFSPLSIEYLVIDRQDGFKILEAGLLDYSDE